MINCIIIDDEAKNIKLLQNMLQMYCPSVNVLATDTVAKNGLLLINEMQPQLVFLDVEMPHLNGFDILKKLEPVNFETIFVTAYSHYAVEAFEHHATGYITKPIKPKILVSKVKALLRRVSQKNSNKKVLSFGNLIINKESYQVSIDNLLIDFPKKEFELLALLASDSERIFNRNEILETIWGNEVVVGERTIDVHIRKIREKIGEAFVATIKGVGYRFIIPDEK